jgi:hypothetical protein
MPVAEIVSFVAHSVASIQGVHSFITIRDEEIDLNYVLFSLTLAIMWLYYHAVNHDGYGSLATLILVSVNLLLIWRCLQYKQRASAR